MLYSTRLSDVKSRIYQLFSERNWKYISCNYNSSFFCSKKREIVENKFLTTRLNLKLKQHGSRFSSIDWKIWKWIVEIIFNTLEFYLLVVLKSIYILWRRGKNKRRMSSWGRNTDVRGREFFIKVSSSISFQTERPVVHEKRNATAFILIIYMLYVLPAEITVWRRPNITTESLKKTV